MKIVNGSKPNRLRCWTIREAVELSESSGGYVFSARQVLGCSADFQSAVSPNCIRQAVGSVPRDAPSQSLAECNSAIRRSSTLRYYALNPSSGEYVFSVAAGVPPAVEPGILPGRLSCGLRGQFRVQRRHSGRQDAALYGSQDGCRHSHQATVNRYSGEAGGFPK